jgi:hypothetical protein
MFRDPFRVSVRDAGQFFECLASGGMMMVILLNLEVYAARDVEKIGKR